MNIRKLLLSLCMAGIGCGNMLATGMTDNESFEPALFEEVVYNHGCFIYTYKTLDSSSAMLVKVRQVYAATERVGEASRLEAPVYIPGKTYHKAHTYNVTRVGTNSLSGLDFAAVVVEPRDVAVSLDDSALAGMTYLDNIVFMCDVDRLGSAALGDSQTTLQTLTFCGTMPQYDAGYFGRDLSGCEVVVLADETGLAAAGGSWESATHTVPMSERESVFAAPLSRNADYGNEYDSLGMHDMGDGTVTVTYLSEPYGEADPFMEYKYSQYPWLMDMATWQDKGYYTNSGSGETVYIPKVIYPFGCDCADESHPQVRAIGNAAFNLNGGGYNTLIRKIATGNGVERILFNAIVDADKGSLTEIVLGTNVREIGLRAIECPNLSTLRVRATTPPSLFSVNSLYRVDRSALKIVVPDGCGAAYRSDAIWTRLGTIYEEAEFGGVEDINADKAEVIGSSYYDMQGRSISDTHRSGVYIRRDDHADGSSSVHKIAR